MASKKPLVSIVTPSLRQGKFIEQTILSIKSQTYPNLQHIVVDGGSKDDTVPILTRYEHAYNMLWISEPDNGMYEAINKGMRRAHGEILAYLNSDDLYLPWTIQTVVDCFLQHSDADIVYGDMIDVPIDGDYHKDAAIVFYPSEWGIGTHLARTILGQPAVFWRRRVFDGLNGFDESFQLASDYDFWMRAASRYRFRKVNEVLAVNRSHPDSKSARNRMWYLREAREAIARNYGRRAMMRISAEKHGILYQVSCNYHMVKLLIFSTRSSPKKGPWRHLLGTQALSFRGLRLLPKFLAYTIDTRKADFQRGFLDANRLLSPQFSSSCTRQG